MTVARFEYLWQDNERYKKPTKMAAPEYVEHLMAWVQSNLDNEQIFPSKIGKFYRHRQHPPRYRRFQWQKKHPRKTIAESLS